MIGNPKQTLKTNTDILEIAAFLGEAMGLVEKAIKRINKSKILRPIERKLERALSVAFKKQGEIFLDKLEGLSGFFPKEEELQEAIIIPAWYTWAMIEAILMEAQGETFLLFAQPIDAAVLLALTAGGLSTFAELAIIPTFEIAASPAALDYLREYGARLVTNIDETTRDYIRTQVTHAMEEGWSYNRTAKVLTERYKEFAIGKPQLHIRSRAHLIAVTEAGNAYTEGQLATAQELQDMGIPMEKYWLNVGDDRVSDGCLENTAAGWIPLNDPFPSKHQRPLRFPGCRCDLLTRRRKER